ncbi:MAG TPA: CAP domain-containing protein [Candidatus Limnocylindrales bacterium]|nr:CAP domain-containing protein [Candidatus Limnocylindrales bacterium]
MVLTLPSLTRRRLASLALVAVLGAVIAAPGAATATVTTVDDATLTAAETAMVSALNADRTDRGLVAVRVDPRLMAIARARSDDMVANSYFSHVQPDGRNVFDILTAQHITWYNAGEIIASNNYPMDSTVSAANRQWLGSPGHYAIITSTDLNYIGVGLAIDPATGKKLWTAVYIKGPDRTSAKATVYTPKVVASPTPTTRRVKVAWTGYDPRLQVLTSGLRSYAIQRRTDGGAWTTVLSSTTARYTYFTLALGHRYEFRISARDRAGNPGAWVTKVIDLR